MLLLADPFHSFVHHVQILGIELIVSVFRPDHHEVSPRHKRAHHSHAQADALSLIHIYRLHYFPQKSAAVLPESSKLLRHCKKQVANLQTDAYAQIVGY